MKKDTICRLCSSCCPVEVDVVEEKLVAAQRKTFLAEEKRIPCPKLNAAPEVVYSPERLTTPLVREKGSTQFKKTSWEEALRLVAKKFNQHKEEAGAQSVAWLRGMAADWGAPWDYPNRLMNLFGSPNTIGNGSICFVARDMAHTLTYGSMAFPEPKNSKCILVWGKNDRNTTLGAAEAILDAKDNGAQLIVIDPIKTELATKADIWLQIKPGHDGLLAMSMIHEIISNDLYDKEFVEEYTTGFEELKKVAAKYPIAAVADTIWLDPEKIRQVTHLYATTKPAALIDGNGLDMHNNVFQSTRAVAILRSLCGNLDKPGGDVLPQPVGVRNIQEKDALPENASPITRDYPLFNNFSETWGNHVQGCVVDAILDQKPYPVKMLVVQSGNPLVTMADSNRTKEAFEKLETLVVIDMFMTQTAQLADIILPASSCFEKTQLNRASIRNNPILLQNEVIAPVGHSWPDWKITFELAKTLGLGKHFPWASAEEAIDYQLEPVGIDVQTLKENPNGLRVEALKYEKYHTKGFATHSGKVEFYSDTLAKAGFSGVPFADGDGTNPISFSDRKKDYPMLGMNGSRNIRFTNSQFRTIPSLLQKRSGCVVDVHPQDAEKIGLLENDPVKIETPKGEIEMETRISTVIRPGSIRIAWGWGDYDPRCNLNNLTEDDSRSAITGTSTSRSFMCRVTKVEV